MPRVSTVTGSDSTCKIGLMDMFTSDRMSANSAMPTHEAPPLMISMPGTIHTAAATAMAVTIQRIMKFMITSFSSGPIMSK